MRPFVMTSLLAATLIVWGCGTSDDLRGPSIPAETGGAAGSANGGAGGQAGEATGGTSGEDSGAPEDGSQPDAPAIDTDGACAHLGQALCERMAACAPLLADVLYAGADSCESLMHSACVESLGLADTIKTAAWTDTCAAAIESWSCESLLTRQTPTECLPPPGPRPDGSPCGEDGQCASAYCRAGVSDRCGQCAPRSSESGPCGKDEDCQPGLQCNTSGVCVAYGLAGSPCAADRPCAAWLSCTGSSPSDATCVPAAGPGQECSSQPGQTPGCKLIDEYFCTSTTHLCQKLGMAAAGDQCGVVGSSYVICTAGSMCKTSGMTGTCLAPGSAGDDCDLVNGPYCEGGLKCVSGVCAAPDLASCN